jgi:hypothetical protein
LKPTSFFDVCISYIRDSMISVLNLAYFTSHANSIASIFFYFLTNNKFSSSSWPKLHYVLYTFPLSIHQLMGTKADSSLTIVK